MDTLLREVRRHFADQRLMVRPAGDKVEARVGGILLFAVWQVKGGGRSLYLASIEGVEGCPQPSLHGALVSALHEAESADWNSPRTYTGDANQLTENAGFMAFRSNNPIH